MRITKTITDIAKRYFFADSLNTDNDSNDYHIVHTTEIKKALEATYKAAYLAGFQAGKRSNNNVLHAA